MLKLFILIIVSMLLVSCRYDAIWTVPNPNNLEKKIIYMKDNRTGICFAFLTSSTNSKIGESQSMTCVPCEKIPECLIKQKDLK
jgi:hypothetical protein